MQFNRCPGCLNEVQKFPCQKCGFNPDTHKVPEYVLPLYTILNGRYLVGKVLGQGGFGITYVGFDLMLEEKVAIKEFYPSGQVSRNYSISSQLQWGSQEKAQTLRQKGVEAFLREARKMAKVEKVPEVVRMRNIFQENETAYIVMDFIEGETLKQKLQRDGTMSWNEAKNIFLPVIQAMESVHQAGMVHRDISPDNLMLMPNGGVKILDLGAAKDLTVNSGESSMVVVKGGFSPVEQYGQRGGSGPWTDVYAMAATMFYALTGTTLPLATDRLYSDTVKWDKLAKVPKNVIEALKKALEVQPKERTQSMGEFLKMLKGEFEPSPLPEPRPGPQPKPKPNKILIGVLVALALCVAALMAMQMFGGSQKASMSTPIRTTLPEAETLARDNGKKKSTEPAQTEPAHVHSWTSATCTTPKFCAVCGATEGSALGHSWKDATQTDPKTCTRCGKTEGNPLGYIEYIDWEYSEVSIQVGMTNAYPCILNEQVKNCYQFTVYGVISSIDYGESVLRGDWRIFVRNAQKEWKQVGTIKVNGVAEYETILYLDSPITFDAICAVPPAGISANYRYSGTFISLCYYVK